MPPVTIAFGETADITLAASYEDHIWSGQGRMPLLEHHWNINLLKSDQR